MSTKMLIEVEEKRRLVQTKASAMIKLVKHQSKGGTPTPSAEPKPPVVQLPHKNDNPKIHLTSYGMRPLYSSVNIDSDKWLLSIDEDARHKLENPPSREDGITAEMEEDLRFLGCDLIQRGSILLKLPQTAAATGQILFQRFYYMRSFAKHHFEHLVMGCLLLAAKIEEAPRRPRDIINVFHRLEGLHRLQRRGYKVTKSPQFRESTANLKPKQLDQSYVNLRNQVIKAERRLLATLGFVVHVKHPHKLIVSYCHILQTSDDVLMQRAWSYMNDGLRTDMFVRYTPETIACACLYLAARTVTPKVKLPDKPYPWFELFDASDRDVKHISTMLLKVLQRKRAPDWHKLNDQLEEIRFGIQKKTEEITVVMNKQITELKVNGATRGSSSDRERDENRRDGGRKRSRSRSIRTRSRSRSRDASRRRRDRDVRDRDIRRRSRSPFDRRDRKNDRRGRGGKGRGGDRSRDRKEERERQKDREREVQRFLTKKRSPSPPNRYRK